MFNYAKVAEWSKTAWRGLEWHIGITGTKKPPIKEANLQYYKLLIKCKRVTLYHKIGLAQCESLRLRLARI